MAVDKNSQAYKALLNKGYTDEQINDMHEQTLAGKSAEEVIRGTYNPEADLNPEYLANMDMNTPIRGGNEAFNEYGDDSAPEKQSTKGGMNEKYTGENTKNSKVNYNPDITTSDLNPYYVYGQKSKVYGTLHPGYIEQRNDNIASALYNEGLVTREDVANYLSKQEGWMDSSEADRANTIEAVWKRIGQFPRKEPDLSKADEIVQDTSGKLYGKTTADTGEPSEGINTLADANSVLTAMQEARVNNLKNFVSNNPADIAEAMLSGVSPYGEQTIRDAKQYYPEFMAEVEAEKKKKLAQQNVNAITNGEEMVTDTGAKSNINNQKADFANNNANATASSAEITQNINTILDKNETAQSAQELMGTLEGEMATLKNRLKNLREEANRAFKGDVPDYLVNAYINNKAQEIQNQLSILEDRYNAAYQRYTTEVSQTQWQMEYKLKKKELALKEKMFEAEQTAAKQGITLDDDSKDSTAAKNEGDDYEVTTLTDEQVSKAVDVLLDKFDNGQLGNAQCATGIQRYYLPLLGISLPNLSSWENKKKLINEDEDYIPKKGDLIIINSGAKLEDGTLSGHIGIVVGVTKDGYVQYMDWNGSVDKDGKGTEKVAMNGIKLGSSKIAGFRNVNKLQGQTSNVTDEYTDAEYEMFEKFLSGELSPTQETNLAQRYGTDLQGMQALAKSAIANRDTGNADSSVTLTTPEGTVSTDSQGRTVITKPDGTTVTYAPGITADYKFIGNGKFDPVLGYDTSLRDLYERVMDADFNVRGLSEEYANLHGRTPEQLGQEARNYQVAKDNGTDEFTDKNRKVSRDYGFAVEKKDVYDRLSNALAKGNGTISSSERQTFLDQLGFDKNDTRAKEKAAEELANFEKWQREELADDSMRGMLKALETIIMQDANQKQRLLIVKDNTDEKGNIYINNTIGEATDWAVAYNFVQANAIFDKLINTKAQGATLYPVSDADMEMIRMASTLLNGLATQDAFRDEINKKYKALRSTIGKPISDEELEAMWGTEGNYLQGLLGGIGLYNPDFSNYLTIGHARHSGLFGGRNYGHKNTNATNTIGNKSGSNSTATYGTGTTGMSDIESAING